MMMMIGLVRVCVDGGVGRAGIWDVMVTCVSGIIEEGAWPYGSVFVATDWSCVAVAYLRPFCAVVIRST